MAAHLTIFCECSNGRFLARLTGLQATEADDSPTPPLAGKVLEPPVLEESVRINNIDTKEPPSLPVGPDLEVQKEASASVDTWIYGVCPKSTHHSQQLVGGI